MMRTPKRRMNGWRRNWTARVYGWTKGGTVILTQWHEDHVGRLRDRPQATRGAHAEWDAGDMAVDGFGPMFDVPSFEGGETVGARDGRLRSVWEL